jgi:transcriptional regulator with AAA-type ATPase domain
VKNPNEVAPSVSSDHSVTFSCDPHEPAIERSEDAPFLFFVLHSAHPIGRSVRYCLAEVDEVRIGRGRVAGAVLRNGSAGRLLEIRITDRLASSEHLRIRRDEQGWLLVDCGSKNGTVLNGASVRSAKLKDDDIIEAGQSFFLFRSAMPCDASDRAALDSSDIRAAATLRSLQPALARIFRDLEKIARSPLSVMVLGETGTGKELIARETHLLSRRHGHFVAQNCGAFAPTLLQSELFGSRKGAFTGATQDRPGLVRSADGGTLFLDEVGDLPVDVQVAFLRVLEQREVTPLGDTKPVRLDFRVISATNQDIDTMVAERRFRADLMARLSAHIVRLPPLRQRREDLGILISTLLKTIAPERARQIGLTTEATRALFQHHWPFNIRELRERLSRALLIADEVLPRASLFPEAAPSGEPAAGERAEQIGLLLKKHHGNVAAVARELRKDPTQIRRWARQSGLDIGRYRSADSEQPS